MITQEMLRDFLKDTGGEIFKNLFESAEAILAKSGSAGKATEENLGDINNDACDIIYYLNILKELIAIKEQQ